MAEYIEHEKLIDELEHLHEDAELSYLGVYDCVKSVPTADVVSVVRCKDCKYAVELDKHCEINRASYRHCTQGRGEEEEYVWHKYKKYFKGYSIVELDDYCSYGERRCFDE